MNKDNIAELNLRFKDSNPEELLRYFLTEYNGEIAFANSFGAEDQVITHMIAAIDKEADIFMLDTGRHFPETYEIMQKTQSRYKVKIKAYFPDSESVEKMVNEKGINLFYKSVENRKQCCQIRKTDPLMRAIKHLDAWITGLRSGQAVTRVGLEKVMWDEANGLLKINPLIDWSEDDVWNFIKDNNVPYNTLHDKGYASIGCQPCTRAIVEGEDVRAGRWWWENPETKECGLHQR
ncbi:MAG: phosphoadenylyl-sulfate reductase [Bacteroidota bacterium]|nr:phosphoadenylyl-sulfate reductase [Bacteroidota bacterium]